MFCPPHNPCAICQPTEEAVTEKKIDRCYTCAIEVKPNEDGQWNGYITDEGVVYCFPCDPEQPEGPLYEDSMSDAEADADALASAGWGTDEDYGYWGDE